MFRIIHQKDPDPKKPEKKPKKDPPVKKPEKPFIRPASAPIQNKRLENVSETFGPIGPISITKHLFSSHQTIKGLRGNRALHMRSSHETLLPG